MSLAQDTHRQTVVSPQDMGEQDVFVINDINLVVPPSQINVQKEDLIYRWRTLRTKTATKIPTGHGQVRVGVSIVFPEAQLLALHRLVVMFKHSPFCYVDNRYLRETIVPDWPIHQNMAFTMIGLSIAPLTGASDAWVCDWIYSCSTTSLTHRTICSERIGKQTGCLILPQIWLLPMLPIPLVGRLTQRLIRRLVRRNLFIPYLGLQMLLYRQ
jgi:hypothetical protein